MRFKLIFTYEGPTIETTRLKKILWVSNSHQSQTVVQ